MPRALASPCIALLAVVLMALPSALAGARKRSVRRADLSVATLAPVPASLKPAASVSIVVTVRNGGKAKAKASVLRAYFAKGRLRAKGDARLFGTIKVPALAPRKRKSLRGSAVVPATLKPGAYRLIACVDDRKAVREANEKNNCRVGARTTLVTSSAGGAGPAPVPTPGAPTPPPPTPPTPTTPPPTTPPPTTPPPTTPPPTPPPPTEPPRPGAGQPVPPPPAAPTPSPAPAAGPATFENGTDFLYTGTKPVQTGVASGTIDASRVAVLRGRVLAADGTALPSVTVTVVDHPELGQTVTRADGHYDLAVNSGGPQTLRFKRPTYLPVDRRVDAPPRDYLTVDDVVMLRFDAKVTAIAPGASGAQVAQSSTTSDASGSRRADLIFPAGTNATMRLPDGKTKALTSLHVRATEYTVGDRGPEAMPGELPPSSAYTYAIDYSVDEAVEAGATRVDFGKPVAVYTDNFIGMPVGKAVPLGSYDIVKKTWDPERNGRVVKIVSVTDGRANLDTDGDGTADTPAALAALGITDAERQQLAGLHNPGAELWRASVTHFSPWDHNWPYGLPDGAAAPNPGDPKPDRPKDPKDPSDPCKANTGSAVDCDAQALRESLPVTGTPFSLAYTSDRTPARQIRSVEIPLVGASVPGSLARVELDVNVAGQHEHREFTPAANLSSTYKWDGRDAYGRLVLASVSGSATIRYVYPALYRFAAENQAAFARYGPAISVSAVKARVEITISKRVQFDLRGVEPVPSALGGWSLDANHQLDLVAKRVALGSGDSLPAPVQSISRLLVDGRDEAGYTAGRQIRDGVWQPDGSVWFADSRQIDDTSPGHQTRIRRRARDGTLSTIATLPAISDFPYDYVTESLAAAPDGGAYFVGLRRSGAGYNGPVLHISADGTTRAVTAGSRDTAATPTPNGGDGLPASSVLLDDPRKLATGPDGSLYIGEPFAKRVQRIRPDGILETVFTAPSEFFLLHDLAVGPDGILHVMLFRGGYGYDTIFRVDGSGALQPEFGGGAASCCETGQRATDVRYTFAGPFDVAPDGSLVVFTESQIVRVDAGGSIVVLGGPGGSVADLDVNREGQILAPIPAVGLGTVEPGIPGFAFDGFAIPSADGSEVYVFNSAGRHERTVDAVTGTTIYAFAYEAAGRLAKVTDRDGRETTIERDSAGKPTAIVAPSGERTALTLDGDGNLASLTRPGNLTTRLRYGAGGLLTGETDAAGGVHSFAYDATGLVSRDTDPDGIATRVTAARRSDGREVTLTSPSGKALKFLSGGDGGAGWLRRVTTAAGGVTTSRIAADGTRTATLSDGSTTSVAPGRDPRFGALARVDGTVAVAEPSGLRTELRHSDRTTGLSDPKDPFSVSSLVDQYFRDRGDSLRRSYDGAPRTLTIADATGHQDRTTYDAKTRPTALLPDQAEATRALDHDTRGRLTKTTQGDKSTTVAYDANDRPVSATDALGHVTRYGYDAAGRPASVKLPGGETYGFAHDALDRLTSLTMPSGAVNRLSFTPAGRSRGFQPPGSGPGYVIDRDADGLAKTTTLPGGRKVTSTRTSGRITSMAYPEATVGVGYAGGDLRVGNVRRTPAGGGTASSLAFGYDGDLQTSLTWTGASSGRYDLAYDNRLRPSQTKLTAGAASATRDISRDGDGRITTLGPFSLSRRGPQGAITGISGGPLSVDQTWDGLGRVASRTDSVNNAAAYAMTLSRDAAGKLTKKVEKLGATTRTYDYAYDANGRLTAVRRDGALVESYAYDADGNRTTRTVTGTTARTASYDAAGKIAKLGTTSYTVGLDGFVTARGPDTFTYSARGELTASKVGNVTESYAYDGLGRLVARTAGGKTWQYFYGNPDQQLQVTGAREPDNTLDTIDYADNGTAFSILRGGTRYYVSTDQVGSPRVVTDANGTAVKVVAYSAYGEVLSDSNPALELPVGYAGGVPDAPAGLVHMGLRNYEPASGRFTSRDPLGLGGGAANLYAYAADDPITLSDQLGFTSGGASLCEGICVGAKLAFTDDGISACVEIGVGAGNSVEFAPDGGLDDSKAYLKASAEAAAGPLAGLELSGELSSDGHCRRTNKVSKVCVLGGCVDTDDGLKFDLNKILEAFAKPELGVEAKAVAGVCQKALW